MNQPDPCTFWDEGRVVEYLEKSGDPNAYVSFAWQCQHDLHQVRTVCPPLAILACVTSAVGFLFLPCFWFEETHLVVAGPLSDAQFAKGNATTISSERAQSTLAGVKLLIRNGADTSLPGTRGPCMNDGRAPISSYAMMRDVEAVTAVVAEKVQPKVRQPVTMGQPKNNIYRQASATLTSSNTMLRTAASAPPRMNRDLETDRWERRIKQYRSMNAMDGVTVPESDAIKLFSDFTFKDIYDKVANEKKLILPESWTEEYNSNVDVGHIPENIKLSLTPKAPVKPATTTTTTTTTNQPKPEDKMEHQMSAKTDEDIHDSMLDLL